MSITEPMRTEHLRRIVKAAATGQTAREIAAELNETGVPVPRAAGHPAGGRGDGYNLPTEPAAPGRWNAAAVTAVLAAPETATLGSSTSTTLTVD